MHFMTSAVVVGLYVVRLVGTDRIEWSWRVCFSCKWSFYCDSMTGGGGGGGVRVVVCSQWSVNYQGCVWGGGGWHTYQVSNTWSICTACVLFFIHCLITEVTTAPRDTCPLPPYPLPPYPLPPDSLPPPPFTSRSVAPPT